MLHSFGNGTDGMMPTASLVLDAGGNLYGTTTAGGTFGGGTLFELTPGGGGWMRGRFPTAVEPNSSYTRQSDP